MSSGVHYLDAIFSALRDAGEHIVAAEGATMRAERTAGSQWNLPLIAAAEQAHRAARASLDAAEAELSSLAPTGRLPALLDELPARLDELRVRLASSEARLSAAETALAAHPLGRA
jgi:hypothetical protein